MGGVGVSSVFAGIDVAARHLHCVGLDEAGRVVSVRLLETNEMDVLGGWASEAEVVCVDAPAQVSTAPHGDDATLSPKFRGGRCAEIALGREFGSWVPWATPTGAMTAGWMLTGLAVFAALGARGIAALEVYPHSGFRELAGHAKLPAKRTAAGIRARVALLGHARRIASCHQERPLIACQMSS
jgi:predicted nuclease with RNAse H fold